MMFRETHTTNLTKAMSDYLSSLNAELPHPLLDALLAFDAETAQRRIFIFRAFVHAYLIRENRVIAFSDSNQFSDLRSWASEGEHGGVEAAGEVEEEEVGAVGEVPFPADTPGRVRRVDDLKSD